jgi:hypothetical protein
VTQVRDIIGLVDHRRHSTYKGSCRSTDTGV